MILISQYHIIIHKVVYPLGWLLPSSKSVFYHSILTIINTVGSSASITFNKKSTQLVPRQLSFNEEYEYVYLNIYYRNI